MSGIFGNMFDFNHNGKLDGFEKTAEYSFLSSVIEAEDKDDLFQAGINPEELEFMSGAERREILEDAGLDPDDYDF